MVWDALFWSLSQKETYVWWAALLLVGLAAFPLTFAFFRFLPDRGYAFTKPLGLVFMTYVLWIGASAGIVPNSRVSLILILLGIGLASLAVARRSRDDLRAFIRGRWGYILLVEALFAVALVVATSLRASVSEIMWNEKPMDFAFLNGILRSDSFPPEDPWLSGHTNPMYIFGHIMVAALTKLTGLSSAITFNLGIALAAALAAVAVFGLVHNLLIVRARPHIAVLFGLVGVGLLLVLANMEGVFELFRRHGIGNQTFYGLLDIHGLDGPMDCQKYPGNCTKWYPTEWFATWWRTTRVSTDHDWRESPIFTFIMGDLHSHTLSIPFVLVGTGVALNFLRWKTVLGGWFWLRRPFYLLGAAVLVGALGYINTWDLPTFLVLVASMAAVRNYLMEGRLNLAVIKQTAAFAVPLALLAWLLYSPFHLNFSPVGGSILPLEAAGNATGPVEAVATRPNHFLYYWGTILWPTGSFLVAALGPWRENRRMLGWALLPALAPFLLWVLLVSGHEGLGGFAEEARARAGWWFTMAFMAAMLTVAALACGRYLTAETREDEGQQSALFALILGGLAILLIMGADLFWVDDPINFRSNTTFRLGYQAWILMSISGAFGLHYILSRWKLSEILAFTHRFAWVAITIALIGAGLVYPVIASMNRTYGFTVRQQLDGLAAFRAANVSEYEAIRWLRENVDGTPVILEAVGAPYTIFGRVSARTGLPTILGWPEHEYRWRGSWEPQGGQRKTDGSWCPSFRCLDVEQIYKSTSMDEAKAMLAKYDVEYVYVGPFEKQAYGEAGMAKFAELGKVDYQNQEVTIYHLRR
ncbi:MAG: hypothetical protein A2V88_15660 [Elusimicrobia bacterium RBG_16_66_12]|nr:MAG: hypothetical protein A2V88_15660 [Elusimicrobia bacterium RBG_16_66_12]